MLHLFPRTGHRDAAGVMLSNLSAALERRGLGLLVHARGPAHHPITTLWGKIAPAGVLLMEELTEAEDAAMKVSVVSVVIALFGRSPEPVELIIG